MLDFQIESDPFKYLFAIATVLVGGRANAIGDPGNFCKVLIYLAFDPIWALTSRAPFSQRELQVWAIQDGWETILNKIAVRADALHMVRHDSELMSAALSIDVSKFWRLDGYVCQIETLNRETDSDLFGNRVASTIASGSAGDQVTLSVGTLGSYREVLELMRRKYHEELKYDIEISAGRILKKAIEQRDGVRLGEVAKADDPADIKIEGLTLGIQHTKADARPWVDLGKKTKGRRDYKNSESITSLFNQLDESVNRKGTCKYPLESRQKMILILDSSILRIPKELVMKYGHERKEHLEKSGYKEVWFVCGFEDEAWCIFQRVE